jgi:hypothetical protein
MENGVPEILSQAAYHWCKQIITELIKINRMNHSSAYIAHKHMLSSDVVEIKTQNCFSLQVPAAMTPGM